MKDLLQKLKGSARMMEWLLLSLALLAATCLIRPALLDVSLYKISLITTGAWLGYWIDRTAFPYARPDDDRVAGGAEFSAAMQRRAVIIAAAVVAASLGA